MLDYYFTSQLPDLSWQTDCDSLGVMLCKVDNDECILSAELAAVNGIVKLWEVRESVERWMRHQGLAQVDMYVRWREPGSGVFGRYKNLHVYYCTKNMPMSCLAWLKNHFLTTIQSKPLPGETDSELLSFVNTSSEALTPLVTATCRLTTGEVRLVTLDDYCATIPVDASLIRRISWNIVDLKAAVIAEEPTAEEVLAVAITVGGRTMTYYKPAVPANAKFRFKNCFGVIELAWLNCVTTTKTKDGRKVAQVARRATLYDLDVTVTHEVETAPLPLAVANWLAQLVTAPQAWLDVSEPILITDGETSISDDAAVMNTAKFTWQRDDARDAMELTPADVNIFVKPPFSHQFD